MSSLNVFYEERLVGFLTEDNDERLSFVYTKEWLAAKDSFPLSICLKLNNKPYGHIATKSFFENLLPEGEVKKNLEEYSNMNIKNEFDFLKKFGRDCAGAFVLSENDSPFSHLKITKKEIKLEILYKYLENKKSLTDAIINNEGGRFSLAGAQDKFPIILENKKLYLPLDNEPTTHIIKPHIRYFNDTHDSPYNEYFCMKLAKNIDLNVPEVDIIDGKFPLFLIERFDRKAEGQKIKRIHQQDFCQAMGITSKKKYESDGGSTFVDNYKLVRDNSCLPIPDLSALLNWLWFNLFIGNNDCHSKNLSLIYTAEGLRISPFYDLLSTVVYNDINKSFSYKIGGQLFWHKLTRKHFEILANELDITDELICKLGFVLSQKIENQLSKTLSNFINRFGSIKVIKSIEKEILKRIKHFKNKIFAKR